MIRARLLGGLAWAASVLLLIAPAWGFNPPVDTAGPLTVSIEGPDVVGQIESPLSVRVILDNKGEAAIQGTVELRVVDAWRANPAEPVSFAVEAKGKATLDFAIVAGAKTYDVLYPIHAFARFRAEGKEQVAHPILIFEAQIAGRHEKSAWNIGELLHKDARSYSGDLGLTWEPYGVAADRALALWQLPLYRTVLGVFGEKPSVSSVAWLGPDPKSGGNFEVVRTALGKVTRDCILIQPPWYQSKAGTMLVEYPLELPRSTPMRLEFATGMPEKKVEGDGATYRVRVAPWDAPDGALGEVVFERHIQEAIWRPATADLTRFAGEKVRLQFEAHPGPKNDPGGDFAYWAEPTLVAGTPAGSAAFPSVGKSGSQVLGTIQRDGQVYEVRVWPGKRGLLDATIGFVAGDEQLLFHGFQFRVLGAQLEELRSAITLVRASEESADGAYQVRHRFHSLLGDFDIVGRLFVEQGVLRAKFRLENGPAPRPWVAVYLEDVAAGSWNEGAKQLYLGHGNVLRRPVAFDLAFEGHALVTSFVGIDFDNGHSVVQAVDVPPTRFSFDPQNRHATIHAANDCQFTFIPTQDAWEGAGIWHDTNGLVAAPGVVDAAGRFCLDRWSGHFVSSAEQLQRAFRYGVNHVLVVWHRWQRWGYDYRLPDIFPPDPELGTLEEMRALIALCKKGGGAFATHDNYIEIYPDADDFSYEKTVAFSAQDRPIRGWCNEGRGAQSYRYRADCVEHFVHRNVKLIGEHLAPNAYFIDVLTSLSPHPFWTSDGQFFDKVYTRNLWRNIFAWIRQELDGALQISESGHDQLIGYVDGSQANHMGVGKPATPNRAFFTWDIDCEAAERIPWYEAAHHDRFVLFGAGYSSRYRAGYDDRLHGSNSDDYLTTEVLTGRPSMCGSMFDYDVVRKYWLTHDLSRAVALRRMKAFEFVGDDVHRQHVSWTGGAEVWVNRGKDDWTVEGVVLPPYGFLARAPVEGGLVEASLCRRDGVMAESSFSPNTLYVNGRLVDRSAKSFEGEIGQEYLARMNPDGKPIAFGQVTTCGGCRLSRDGERLLVTPLPESPVPTFSVAIHWSKLPWALSQPTKIEAIDEEGRVVSTKPVERSGDTIAVPCEPGVFQYRLVR